MYRYYSDKLAAERLRRVYEIAPPRVRQYLEAEVAHVLTHVKPADTVIELGCGYGRVLPALGLRARLVVGIDTAQASLLSGAREIARLGNGLVAAMDAVHLGFPDGTFDCVVCIQNGLSAFHADRRELVREGIRVTKRGGLALFSTYSGRFWDVRLDWFRMQAADGLLGEIDEAKTGAGTIVCKDGFTASTLSAADLVSLVEGLEVKARTLEVDESSLFLEVTRLK